MKEDNTLGGNGQTSGIIWYAYMHLVRVTELFFLLIKLVFYLSIHWAAIRVNFTVCHLMAGPLPQPLGKATNAAVAAS